MFLARATFLKATVAALFTGGLDVWTEPGAFVPATLRVLISADRGDDTPRLADGGIFFFAGRRWRGVPSIVALPNGRSGVVATVDIDGYLYGVLPIEAAPGWPPTALAAHAIVARTFALSRRTPARPYDVVVSQHDQRFGGIESEFPATNAAVDATRNAVLTYDGANASVFYAACCGGHTADAAEIWGHAALPYLRGVNDPYCATAPDYRWQRSVSLDTVRRALGARIDGGITGFALGRLDSGGRPLDLDVICGAQRVTLSTIDFRNAIGPDIVRSTWIRGLRIDGPQVVIDGSGRGHGVGFCQWGARAMGAAHAPAADILAFYFPGTRIMTVDAGGR
jgi:stage II sporulation protein D